jgi:putative DNA primase/helicase
MTNINIQEISSYALSKYPDLLFQWIPSGRIHGHEFKCGSVQGEPGDSLSVNVRTGMWADFSTNDRGGDPVSLYAAIRGISQLDSARELAIQFGLIDPVNYKPVEGVKRTPPPPRPEPEPDFVQIIPAPDGAPPMKHPLGTPAKVWAYRTIAGELIGYVLRFNKPDGKKEIVPLCYGNFKGKPQWKFKHFGTPRPLYNLPALVDPKRQVLIVEGEKCADHAAALFPSLAVVSWPGGGKATGKVDWSPLTGRKVAIWPDADEAGYKTAQDIADRLRAIGCAIKFVLPPDDAPKGWDVADSDLTPETAMAWTKPRLSNELSRISGQLTAPEPVAQPDPEPAPIEEPPPYDVPPPEAYDYEPDPAPAPETPTAPSVEYYTPATVLASAPFRCLGFERDHFYFFNYEKQQIVSMTAGTMTKNNILALAPRLFWMDYFKKGKSDFDMDEITDTLIRESYRVGIFDPDTIRGRGAWWDDDGVAIHLGDRVIYACDVHKPAKVPSKYIYELAKPLAGDITKPLSNKEANRFMNLMEMLPWSNPMYAKLAAGWCVIAPIGGVLPWRPHLWIIGARGSGKTYTMSNIIKPMLGKNCLFVQSSSTEAGIRQRLGRDSLPVLFDEAEGETNQALENMQKVLQLMRSASSESGAETSKGTPGGKAQSFLVRSCFCMSSINATLIQTADKTRVSVLELSPDHRHFEFELIKEVEATTLTPEYRAGFYARAMNLAPVIRENARVFADAAAVALGEQRAGDQVGTLLAGAYSLYSDKPITYEKAIEWIKSQDWTEQKDDIKGEKDEHLLWAALMQHKIRVKIDGSSDRELPIGVLIDAKRGGQAVDGLTPGNADTHLQHIGFKVEPSGVYVSNTSTAIKTILRGTPWPVGWSRILKRLPDACPGGVVYFGYRGSESRAVFVPIK